MTALDIIAITGFFFAVLSLAVQVFYSKKQIKAQLAIAKEQFDTQLKIAEKQFNAEVRSRNRQEWINTLREELSEFLSLLTPLIESPPESDSDEDESWQYFIENRRQIDKCAIKIELMINRDKPEQEKLADLVEDIRILIMEISYEEKEKLFVQKIKKVDEKTEELVPIAQGIFKGVWERVKRGE